MSIPKDFVSAHTKTISYDDSNQNTPLHKNAVSKHKVAKEYSSVFLLKSIVGGFFIGVGATSMIGIGTLTNPIGSGIAFSIALILIIFTKSELATGNMLTMVFAGSKRRVVLVALFTTVGNFIGAVAFSLLVWSTGFLTAPRAEYLAGVIDAKTSVPFWVILIKGILCNMMVCLAVYMCAVLDNYVAKILVTIFCITVFVVCGWEHSIANMSIFTYGIANGRIDLVFTCIVDIVVAWCGNFIGGVGLGFLLNKYRG
jgi:nitrite transporter NirC